MGEDGGSGITVEVVWKEDGREQIGDVQLNDPVIIGYLRKRQRNRAETCSEVY